MFKKTDKAASIKLKCQLGYNLLELIVILSAVAIIAAIAVPIYFDFSDKADEKLLEPAIAELSGREKLAFLDIKKSQDGWVNDQIVFSQVDTDMGSDFH